MERRVVVTGMGTLNPLANGVEEYWRRVKNLENGISRVSRFDASSFSSQVGGEVKDFMPENYLLENISRLHHLPAIVVQGRYDMVCPMVTADELCRAWPEAELVVVQEAGHSAMEPGIRSALVAATETFKTPRRGRL